MCAPFRFWCRPNADQGQVRCVPIGVPTKVKPRWWRTSRGWPLSSVACASSQTIIIGVENQPQAAILQSHVTFTFDHTSWFGFVGNARSESWRRRMDGGEGRSASALAARSTVTNDCIIIIFFCRGCLGCWKRSRWLLTLTFRLLLGIGIAFSKCDGQVFPQLSGYTGQHWLTHFDCL